MYVCVLVVTDNIDSYCACYTRGDGHVKRVAMLNCIVSCKDLANVQNKRGAWGGVVVKALRY